MGLLVGQGPIALPGAGGGGYTSSVFSQTSPQPGQWPPVRLGTRAQDQDGNIFVFCDFVGTVFGGMPVQIFDDYTAQALGLTGRGKIGIAQTNGTSDQGGWVQIYGRAIVQVGGSGTSVSDAANGPTTLSNSLATVFVLQSTVTTPAGALSYVSGAAAAATSILQYVVQGMWVASDVTIGDASAVTSATSHTGQQVAVFLNYPFIAPTDITT